MFLPEGLPHRHGAILRAGSVGCEALTPGLGLGIEIGEVRERPSRKEAIPDITDGALDATLLIAAGDGDWPWLIAVMSGELEDFGVEADRRALPLQDGAFEVVLQKNPRDPYEGIEGRPVGPEEVGHPGIEAEAQEDLPGIGQHHHEAHQRPFGPADRELAE